MSGIAKNVSLLAAGVLVAGAVVFYSHVSSEAAESDVTSSSSTASSAATVAAAAPAVAGSAATESHFADFKKPPEQVLKDKLTPMQYEVTQEDGTEPPFQNAYWNNKRAGIYVDVISGEPLFSSTDKFKSGTGWPSFTRPITPEAMVTREDKSLFFTRTELRSRHADSHLGHVFEDGPAPTGLRYCINSAALDFIPKEKLEEKGYGEFLSLFE